MFGVEALRDELKSVVGRLDPVVLEPGTAQILVEQFAAIENLAAAAKAVCAKRVADSGSWRLAGDRSAAHWLARTTGTTVTAAHDSLATVARLAELPAVDDAVRSGQLTALQAQRWRRPPRRPRPPRPSCCRRRRPIRSSDSGRRAARSAPPRCPRPTKRPGIGRSTPAGTCAAGPIATARRAASGGWPPTTAPGSPPCSTPTSTGSSPPPAPRVRVSPMRPTPPMRSWRWPPEVTRVDDCDRLCDHHHRLKTRSGWRLAAGTGKQPIHPPDQPVDRPTSGP
jgi:hypothetical protein